MAAVLVLSAMTAAAVSAQPGMITSDGPFWLDGADAGEPSERALTLFGGSVECEQAHYKGGKVDGTFEPDPGETHHESLPASASAFTVTPEYTNCTTNGLPETVTMNGCDYDVHIIPTTGPDTYAATADLTCPEGEEVTIDIYGNAEAHAANIPACVIHVPPQAKLGGLRIKDETNGHLALGGTAKGIELTLTGAPCGAEEPITTTEAELHLSITLQGTDEYTNGSNTPLSLSHE